MINLIIRALLILITLFIPVAHADYITDLANHQTGQPNPDSGNSVVNAVGNAAIGAVTAMGYTTGTTSTSDGGYSGGGGSTGGGGAGGSWEQCTDTCQSIASINQAGEQARYNNPTITISVVGQVGNTCSFHGTGNNYAYDWSKDLSCTTPPTCQAGQHLEGNSCVTDPPTTCPTGQHLEGTSCVADPPKVCPTGQHLEGNSCVADPSTGDKCDCCEQLAAISSKLDSIIALLNKKGSDVDLSTVQDLLRQLIAVTSANKPKDVDLSKIEAALNAIDTDVKLNKYDDSKLQAKIDNLASQLKDTNSKLDAILAELQRPKECKDGEFNKTICDFTAWYMGKFDLAKQDSGTPITTVSTDSIDWQSWAEKNYLTLPSGCPGNPFFNVPFLGAISNIVFPVGVICKGCVIMKPFILLWAFARAIGIIGSTNI